MNKLRGVRRYRSALLLLGLLACITETGAAADLVDPPGKRLNAAPTTSAGLDQGQWCILDLARDFGARIHLPETMQAIVLAESSAGHFLENPDDPSYGVAGVKPKTAEAMLGHPVSVTELRDDAVLNLTAGSLFLQQCAQAFASWRRQVVCYNRGAAGAAAMSDAEIAADFYFLTIKGRLEEVRADRRHVSLCPKD